MTIDKEDPADEPTVEQLAPPAPPDATDAPVSDIDPLAADNNPAPPATGRGWSRWFAVGVLSLALLAAVGAAGFFVGQGTRKSDEQVSTEQAAAVKKAVTIAVAKKGAEDKAQRLRIMHRAATRMNAKHRAEVRRMRQTAARRANEAYSAGSSVGRATGYNEGIDDGITKASDDLVCSDDPDVPLPPCYDW